MEKIQLQGEENLWIRDFVDDDLDAIIQGQKDLYAREYNLNTDIWRSYMVEAVQDFANRFNPEQDCMLVAEYNGKVSGGAAITHIDEETAQFRFFYLDESLRGKGIGRKLFDLTLEFCQERNYRRVILWTFDTLAAARHLYEEKGFVITEKKQHADWGPLLTEEKWEQEL